MKTTRQILIALAVAFVSVSAFAEQPNPVGNPAELGFSGDRLERVTKAFQTYFDNGQIPGPVVLIARKHTVAYFRAIGFRDREQKTPMTTDSISRLASMTKPTA